MSTVIGTTETTSKRYKCSHCGHRIRTEDGAPLPQECPNCQARLKRKVVRVPSRAVARPPVVVHSDPWDFVEEKKADLRERREAREEGRRYYREDRQSNLLGISGFAINATIMLVMLSSWMFAKSLPAYLYVSATLAIPTAIIGLVLCIIASFSPSRERVLAIIGGGIGAILVLFMLPMSFTLREMLGK